MKLDTKTSYGHIFGNHAATYVQHGKFFDGAGNEIDEDGLVKDSGDAKDLDKVEEAQNFLRILISDNAMSKAKIVKQSEVENLSWGDVKEAADLLNVIKYKQGAAEMWKLI